MLDKLDLVADSTAGNFLVMKFLINLHAQLWHESSHYVRHRKHHTHTMSTSDPRSHERKAHQNVSQPYRIWELATVIEGLRRNLRFDHVLGALDTLTIFLVVRQEIWDLAEGVLL